MCLWVPVYASSHSDRPEEDMWFPGAGVTATRAPLDMGTYIGARSQMSIF